MTICPSSHSSRRLADARVTRVAAGVNPAAKRTDAHFITMPGSRKRADATRGLFLGHQRPAPTELVAQPLVEGFRRAESNDLEPLRMGSGSDDIADRHLMSAALAVDAHLSGPTDHAQTDVLTWSKYDRTHGQRERAHRHQQEVFERRLQDRAAAGKSVRARPAGGRHDGAVRVDDAHPLSAHVDLEAQDPRLTRVVHHNLVQADLLHQGLALTSQ